ncbi:unnamed protein product, partial [Gulo gulo]
SPRSRRWEDPAAGPRSALREGTVVPPGRPSPEGSPTVRRPRRPARAATIAPPAAPATAVSRRDLSSRLIAG